VIIQLRIAIGSARTCIHCRYCASVGESKRARNAPPRDSARSLIDNRKLRTLSASLRSFVSFDYESGLEEAILPELAFQRRKIRQIRDYNDNSLRSARHPDDTHTHTHTRARARTGMHTLFRKTSLRRCREDAKEE